MTPPPACAGACLRDASPAGLSRFHAPPAIPLGRFDRRAEPRLDQPQHVGTDNTAGQRLPQRLVRDGVEIPAQIGIDHVGVTLPKQGQHRLDRLTRAAPWPIAMCSGVQVGCEDRFHHQFDGGLPHPVPDCRDTKWPPAAARLGDHHPPHRLAPIGLRSQRLAQPGQPLRQPRRLDLLEYHRVHPWRTFVGARQVIRMAQNVRAPDLVVEAVEPETGRSLRLAIALPLQSPDRIRCWQAHRQSPQLVRCENAAEVRALPATRVTRLRRHYEPVRRPPGAAPCRTVAAATRVQNKPPPLARSPVSTCRAAYPGGPLQVPLSAAAPDRAGCPKLRATEHAKAAGRRPQLPSRGLLRLHTRYGRSICAPAQGELCRRAAMPPVTQPHRPPATRPTDHCPGATCTHTVIAPCGAHRSTRSATGRHHGSP